MITFQIPINKQKKKKNLIKIIIIIIMIFEKINDMLLIDKVSRIKKFNSNNNDNKRIEIPFIKDSFQIDKKIMNDQNNLIESKKFDSINNEANKINDNIYRDYNNEKLLDKLFIAEYDLIGSKKDNNYCYQKINYANKNFYMIYSSRLALQYSNIYYYYSNHRTTKFSTDYDSKGNKKKLVYVKLK